MNALTKAMKFYMIICNMPITTLRNHLDEQTPRYIFKIVFFFKKEYYLRSKMQLL